MTDREPVPFERPDRCAPGACADSGAGVLRKAADLLLSAAEDQERAGRPRLAASHRARAAALLDELDMSEGGTPKADQD